MGGFLIGVFCPRGGGGGLLSGGLCQGRCCCCLVPYNTSTNEFSVNYRNVSEILLKALLNTLSTSGYISRHLGSRTIC